MRSSPSAGPAWFRLLLRGSLGVTVLGFVASVVMFFRPWTECAEYEDAPLGAGCPVEGPEVYLVQGALLLFLLGVLGLLASVVTAGRAARG
ncbi:hypothetical protein CLV92_1106 [Kineococcus xinjiangensis]|uniref:Transmembrane protein n=1 Tax=Kineococcus xinjiangensis TaxID=512762 RepID=A0A2S6IGN4_9ACTN|nr:hypothetical protein [Kineococcus xinjiangensis]PPK93378.1 hypothetical protein CLV92_1106 [Kineococcus xinjiangensis]